MERKRRCLVLELAMTEKPLPLDAWHRARFEVLLGFQLDPDQLRYNATR